MTTKITLLPMHGPNAVVEDPPSVTVGPWWARGPSGPGVPPGGDAGDVYVKKTNDDYDGEWVDPSALVLLSMVWTSSNW